MFDKTYDSEILWSPAGTNCRRTSSSYIDTGTICSGGASNLTSNSRLSTKTCKLLNPCKTWTWSPPTCPWVARSSPPGTYCSIPSTVTPQRYKSRWSNKCTSRALQSCLWKRSQFTRCEEPYRTGSIDRYNWVSPSSLRYRAWIRGWYISSLRSKSLEGQRMIWSEWVGLPKRRTESPPKTCNFTWPRLARVTQTINWTKFPSQTTVFQQ